MTDRYSARNLSIAVRRDRRVSAVAMGFAWTPALFMVAVAGFGAAITAAAPATQVLVLDSVDAAAAALGLRLPVHRAGTGNRRSVPSSPATWSTSRPRTACGRRSRSRRVGFAAAPCCSLPIKACNPVGSSVDEARDDAREGTHRALPSPARQPPDPAARARLDRLGRRLLRSVRHRAAGARPGQARRRPERDRDRDGTELRRHRRAAGVDRPGHQEAQRRVAADRGCRHLGCDLAASRGRAVHGTGARRDDLRGRVRVLRPRRDVVRADPQPDGCRRRPRGHGRHDPRPARCGTHRDVCGGAARCRAASSPSTCRTSSCCCTSRSTCSAACSPGGCSGSYSGAATPVEARAQGDALDAAQILVA